MAISASNTKKVENDFQAALAEKQRQEKLKRKQQEEKERKEKELEAKLRLKHLEEEKRNQERQKRLEAERAAKQKEMERREAEIRDNLRYGSKRSKTEYPSSSAARRRRDSPSDDEGGGGSALTREEKRRQRMEREMAYGLKSSRRPANYSGYQKTGKRLPGGAVDIVTQGPNSKTEREVDNRPVRERFADSKQNGLFMLNTEKRDMRTPDEVQRDLKAKKAGRVLEGDATREFFANGFFSTSKNKQAPGPSQGSSVFGSRGSSLEKDPSKVSGKNTPSKSLTPPIQTKPATSATSTSKPSASTPARGSNLSARAIGKLPATSSLASKTPSKFPPSKAPASASKFSSTSARPQSKPSRPAGPSFKKRPRSPSMESMSPSPPPMSKKRAAPKDNISSEIWALFGKNRDSYVGRDIMSDDEDMEADARDLEREEMYRYVSRFIHLSKLILIFIPGIVLALLAEKMRRL